MNKNLNRFKNYLSILFGPEKREQGIAPLVAYGIYAILAGSTLWVATRGVSQAVKDIIGAVITLLLNISRYLIMLASNLLGQVTASDFVQQSIINSNVTQHGWLIVRDFANMFVVLGFVVVGLATILRIQEYQATKTLLPLIIVAILINFSMVMCGVFIDASNITMAYFLGAGGTQALTQPFVDASQDPNVAAKLRQFKESDDQNNYIMVAAAQTMSNSLAAMIFFMFAILFLLRHVSLICLVILSPLAIVSYVFPKTRASIFQKWAEQFTQWLIIGIPSAFFMYIAAYVRVFEFSAGPTNLMNLNYWVPLGFLMAAYTFCFQTSAMGAGAAMGLATGAAGMAWGATKKAGTWTGKKAVGAVKETPAYKKIGGAVGRGMETLGLREAGTTAMNQQALLKSSTGRMEALRDSNPAQFRRIAETGSGMDSAAALKVAAEKGELHKFDQTKLPGAMARAKGHGVSMDTFHKSDPVLAMQSPANPSAQDLQAIGGVVSNMDKKESRGLIRKGVPVKPQLLGALSGGQMGDILKNGKPAQLTTLQQSVQGDEKKNALTYWRSLRAGGNKAEARNLITNMQMIKSSGIKAPPRPPASTAAKPATPPSPKPAPTGPSVAPRGTPIPPPGAGVKAPTGPSAPPRGTPVAPSAKPKPTKKP